MSVALIGGTGLHRLPGLAVHRSHAVDTPFGAPSSTVEEGDFAGVRVFFLHRHGGAGRPLPPHLINYRANAWALHALGVRAVVAINAVGAIDPALAPGALAVPEQIIDYTWGRQHTFDDGSSGSLQHVEFTDPYTGSLRQCLLDAAGAAGVPCADGGVMAVTQGPRLETAAEIGRLARDGCTVVGMTAMPEAALARELGLDYASLCVVVNAAAGMSEEPIAMDAIRAVLAGAADAVAAVLTAALPRIGT